MRAVQADLVVAPGVVVPGALLAVAFSRSGGPGGQNVNKVSSRVTLSFDLAGTDVLTPSQKVRASRLAGRRLAKNGFVHIVSQATRDQHRNIEDARERLRELLARALPEPKVRRPTKIPRGVRKERVEQKRRRAEVKRGRRVPQDD